MIDIRQTADRLFHLLSKSGVAGEVVAIRDVKTGVRTAVRANVADGTFDGVILDGESDTTVKSKRIMFARRGRGGWNRAELPNVGDVVSLMTGKEYAVAKVEEKHDAIIIVEARQC